MYDIIVAKSLAPETVRRQPLTFPFTLAILILCSAKLFEKGT